MPKAYSDYSKHLVIYLPPPGPQTGRYIAKIAAGGNQGNRMRNRQVLSKIYRVGVGCMEARECKTIKTERTMERNGPCNGTEQTVEWNGTNRFALFLGKCCLRTTQTERTVFRKFLDAYRSCIRSKVVHKRRRKKRLVLVLLE